MPMWDPANLLNVYSLGAKINSLKKLFLSSGCATVSKSTTADSLLMDSEPENGLLDLENGLPSQTNF